MSEPRQPCECGKVLEPDEHHCWMHHCDETGGPEYIYCGECFHVWRTAADLLRAYNDERPQPSPPETDPTRVYFCPLCLHDF